MSEDNFNKFSYNLNNKCNPSECDPRTYSGHSHINKCNYSNLPNNEGNYCESSCNTYEVSDSSTFNYNDYSNGQSTGKDGNKFNINFATRVNSEMLPYQSGEFNFNVDVQNQVNRELFSLHPPSMLPPPAFNFFHPSSNPFSTSVPAPPLKMDSPSQNPFPPSAFPQSSVAQFPPSLPSSSFNTVPLNYSGPSVRPPFDMSCPPPMIVKNTDEKDPSIWLDLWTKRRVSTFSQPVLKTKITISEYKKKSIHLMTQMKELEKVTTLLQVLSKSLTDEEWEIRRKEVENQKEIVEKAVNELKIIPLPEIMSLLNKRKSKRTRLKRKREEYNETRKANKALCHLEHSRIDMWLDKMKEQVERTRREEDIKKQADFVLSEVFHKKAEAKRMLNLLTTLGKLRNARIHDRELKGEFVSQEAASAFNSIIETLKKLWMKQINGYNVEEQGLRVMLDDAEVKRSNIEKSVNKQILQQWLSIMFGGQDNKNDSFKITDVNQLITVRNSWDQYVVKDNSDVGSSMPIGWILPTAPSSNSWKKFLKS